MTPLFYNIEILQAAGFDRPPKNQDEFAAFAKAVTDPKADRYGFALGLGEQDPQGVYRDIFPWIWAAGQPMTESGDLKFDTPQAAAALRFLQGLIQEGVIAPGSFTKTGKDRLEEFNAGKIGMMIASIQDVRALASDPRSADQRSVDQKSSVPFGITTIPAPASYFGKPVFGLTNWCAGISRTGKHKDEAWAFIAFLSERAPLIAARSGAIHGSSNAVDADQNDDPLSAKAYDIYEAGDALEEFAGFPGEVFLERVVREEVRRLLEENQSPEYTAAVVQKRFAQGTPRTGTQ
jgi:multiple sugar transport system substrate-binding protein